MVGPYCAQCGEKKLIPKDYSLPHLAEELLGVFTHLDSKFLRTIKVLLTRPGELSNAYFHGGRSRFTKPLTLFVIINVVFFFVQPHTGVWGFRYAGYLNNPRHATAVRAHLAGTKEPEQSYAARFNANLQNQKKSMLIVSVPVLAIVMALLFVGTRRTYAEHLVFSVQVYAFLLIYMLTVILLILFLSTVLLRTLGSAALPLIRMIDGNMGIAAVTLVGLTIYMYKGLRRAYDASRPRAALTAFLLAWAMMFLVGVYHLALFYVTFWTT